MSGNSSSKWKIPISEKMTEWSCTKVGVYMFINAVANNIMLYLYLWCELHNIVFRIKHKLYIASESVPPHWKILGVRLSVRISWCTAKCTVSAQITPIVTGRTTWRNNHYWYAKSSLLVCGLKKNQNIKLIKILKKIDHNWRIENNRP